MFDATFMTFMVHSDRTVPRPDNKSLQCLVMINNASLDATKTTGKKRDECVLNKEVAMPSSSTTEESFRKTSFHDTKIPFF